MTLSLFNPVSKNYSPRRAFKNKGVRILFDLGYMKDLMGEVCSIRQDGTQVRSTIDGEVKILNLKNLRRVRVIGPVEVDSVDNMVNLRNQPIASMPPHVYGLAEGMYQNLLHDGVDQVVIISGESGAGKTEAFKRILRHLAASSEGDQITWGSAAQGVLESTPLLESFGNATTLRNDNSSRFGKFVEVFFTGPSIIGARVTNYLLEKSRVVQQSTGERNYHIFYQFLSGLDKETKNAHHFTSVSDFAYLQYVETLDHIASELSINRQTLANVLTTKVTRLNLACFKVSSCEISVPQLWIKKSAEHSLQERVVILLAYYSYFLPLFGIVDMFDWFPCSSFVNQVITQYNNGRIPRHCSRLILVSNTFTNAYLSTGLCKNWHFGAYPRTQKRLYDRLNFTCTLVTGIK
ncbi:Myosin ID heavy chain [Echinococcus granulosus]|uniref:Myosin ID heavy chain n=1 Tax=Echinococcus granulosus TaxID=6210 RepID=W6U4R4_ECHGR|nr:Myosin ID heavy chain [Echinococcus granulosus]EUB55541.1 Myosin ID heavy chain [Echinococcus granulosus]